jgi:hypothetical protein
VPCSMSVVEFTANETLLDKHRNVSRAAWKRFRPSASLRVCAVISVVLQGARLLHITEQISVIFSIAIVLSATMMIVNVACQEIGRRRIPGMSTPRAGPSFHRSKLRASFQVGACEPGPERPP